MDASEIYSKRLDAKEVIFPKEKRKIIFLIADGRITFFGGDQELRTSTLIRQRPFREEGHEDFLGKSEGSLPPPPDSFPDAGEVINDFWSMSGNFIHLIKNGIRIQCNTENFVPIVVPGLSKTTS